MVKELVFYCDRSAILGSIPCNEGIDEALKRLEELRSRGIDVKVVDTAHIGEKEIYADYLRAIQPSVRNKYSVRQIFGSRKRSGWLFGRAVPALLVLEPSGNVADVFPRNESGRIVTIQDALNRATRLN